MSSFSHLFPRLPTIACLQRKVFGLLRVGRGEYSPRRPDDCLRRGESVAGFSRSLPFSFCVPNRVFHYPPKACRKVSHFADSPGWLQRARAARTWPTARLDAEAIRVNQRSATLF